MDYLNGGQCRCARWALDLRWSRFYTMIVLYMCMSIPAAINRTPMRQTRTRRTRAEGRETNLHPDRSTEAPDLNEGQLVKPGALSRAHTYGLLART